jgi:hypothetical protein
MSRVVVQVLVVALALALLCVPMQAILRGDERQKLHDERSRVREEMHLHELGSDKRRELQQAFHLLQHKVRALDLFEHGLSQAEYDDFIGLIDRKAQLKATHSRDNFNPEERKEFAQISRKIDDVLNKYKTVRKSKQSSRKVENEEEQKRVVELRKRLSETTDRDEMEVRCMGRGVRGGEGAGGRWLARVAWHV